MTRRDDLQDLRRRLDGLDREIVERLADRRDVVEAIIRFKDSSDSELRDTGREEQLLAKLQAVGREKGLDGYFVTRVFHEIIDYSLRVQKEHLIRAQSGPAPERLAVGYQGVEGAYSFFAARKFFASDEDRLDLTGYTTFREMVEHVERGTLDFAVLPVENTTAGVINESYDLLLAKSVAVVGEEVVPVKHCLMALEDVSLTRIHRVFSHPQALAQCSDFLATLDNCQVESFTDTAMAARRVRDEQDLSQAAIASEAAARFYGLKVLRRDLANQRENFTRFMILAAEPASFDRRIPCKTSLIFATGHTEGALVRCLNGLARHGLNLTKLESRPRANVPWEYVFYVDFEGNLADDSVREAIEELKADTVFVKVLGTYPARTLKGNRPAHPPAIPSTSQARAAGEGTDAATTPAPPAILTGRSRLTASEEVRRSLATKPFRLASRLHQPDDTVLRVGDVEIGGNDFVVFAGPRSIGSREELFETARAVREAGARILRGDAFRSRAGAAEPRGFAGLDDLAEAGRTYGMPIVTEVLEPSHVDEVARVADLLCVGADSMQNLALLRAVGRVDRPVILERGRMASIDEWISAAELVLSQGNQQVILCERGIRTFETATANTLDLSAVAIVREWSHLPIVVDPCDAVGVWRWVPSLAMAARGAGAHGVSLEVESDPDTASAERASALRPSTFARVMHDLGRWRPASGEAHATAASPASD